jgi:hypothetical protein
MSAAMLSGRNVSKLALAALAGKASDELPDQDEGKEELIDEPNQEMAPGPGAQPAVAIALGKIPPLTLVAAGSGRKLSLQRLGVPAALIFHNQDNAALAGQVNNAVRKHYPLASQVLVASVANLQGVPRLFRGMAEGAMRKAYQDASVNLPAGVKAEDYVIILPDWDGKLTSSVADSGGLEDMDKTASIAVIDAEGALVGIYQGQDLAQKAVEFLQGLES